MTSLLDSQREDSFCLGDVRCISFMFLPGKQHCLNPAVPGLPGNPCLPLFLGGGYSIHKVLAISPAPLTPLFVSWNFIFWWTIYVICSCFPTGQSME